MSYNQGMIRTRIFTLLAIVATLALTLVAAGCGGDEGGGSSEEARALLEKAFSQQVDSADIKLDAKAEFDGLAQLAGPLSLTLEGPFKSDGPRDLPVLDWKIEAAGAGQEFAAGLVVTDDNAYITYQGESYEVGPELFAQFKQQYAAQQPDEQPTLKSLGLDPTTWLEDPQLEDGEDIGGDPTRAVTGSVDVEQVIRDFIEFSKSDAFRRQLEAQGRSLPQFEEPTDEEIQKIEDAIDELTLQVNVDDNDIARRLAIQADFTVPEDQVQDGGIKGGSVSFGYVFNEVGIEPEVQAPENARPLSELTQQFGGLLGGGIPQPTP